MKLLFVSTIVIGLIISDTVSGTTELHQDAVISRKKRSSNGSSCPYNLQPEYPKDCKEVYDQCEEHAFDGVYLIKPEGSPKPFQVYCNNSIDGGGWTVIQRRIDGSVDFSRNWPNYKNGFGFLRTEFWLGNDKISYLTNQGTYELRIDLNNVIGQPLFVKYNLFRISDEGSKYRLVGLGEYHRESSTAYDAMSIHRNCYFSTIGRDNDKSYNIHCGNRYQSGWWYKECYEANLNGLYNPGTSADKGITWFQLPGGRHRIKYTEMKIRPVEDM